MAGTTCDLAIIGGRPGGYVAAIRATQLGMSVACVEQEEALGGTCLRVGCIPSKALLESSERFVEAREGLGQHGIGVGEVTLDLAAMLKRKDQIVRTLARGVDGLFRKHGISRYRGHGWIAAPGKVVVEGNEPTELGATHILIATGSKPSALPGIAVDVDRIGTSTEALSYPEVPEHLVVIGAGYIGLELGSVWRRLGARVTVLEYLDRILPGMDAELAGEAAKVFKKQGFEFRLGIRVTGARVEGGRCVVEAEGHEPLQCDRVLVAVGRVPNTDGSGLEALGIETDRRGRIVVGEGFATNVPGVYAVGDAIPGPMLAHKASEEGIACVERLATGCGHVEYAAIPGIVYTQPEIASVGKTEAELVETGVAYRRGAFSFLANGRARCIGHTEGWVKVLADARTDRILGVHIIGPRAGDLIAEAAAAIAFAASSEDVARTPHAHPTLAEALKEAALAVDERPIHV